MKICLDAGHQGRYNQSPADHRYYESVMVWKLHLLHHFDGAVCIVLAEEVSGRVWN